MLYADARPLIASGDLLAFVKPAVRFAVIRTWTGGSYSHVGIAWRHLDRVYVLAAREPRGVGLDALSTQVPAYWLRTGAAWSADVERLALVASGCPTPMPMRPGGSRPGPRNPYEVCSVYAATILKAAGVGLQMPSYTPSSLVRHCSATAATCG